MSATETQASVTERLSKDDLVLGMLAVLGGDRESVNERDLFLACWHAFPNTMRWTDTALPNPDTFTASLRRLDARKLIAREGKQRRARRGRSSSGRRRPALDVARSGIVKARLAAQALERAEITEADLADLRELRPEPASYKSVAPEVLVASVVRSREAAGRPSDEGTLLETVFHKFPAVFAYEARPEFPDTDCVRQAIRRAVERGLLTDRLVVTEAGAKATEEWAGGRPIQLDSSEAFKTGALRLASRIEQTPGYQAYRENGTLVATKADELYRALRVPPNPDPAPVARALEQRIKELRRVDKGEVAIYLLRLAGRWNEDVAVLLDGQDRELARSEVTDG